jgi:hypothetical protein
MEVVGLLVVVAFLGLVAAGVGDRLRGARPLAEARRRLREGAPRLADHAAVTLTGTVRVRDDLIEAPLTGRLVVFHLSVARVSELGVQVVEHELVPFELETAEGIVRVEGATADVAFPPVPVIPRQIERVQRFLTAHGIAFEHALGASIDEIAVEPGARIAVHGVVQVELDPSNAGERGFREPAPTRTTLRAAPDHPLTLGPPR